MNTSYRMYGTVVALPAISFYPSREFIEDVIEENRRPRGKPRYALIPSGGSGVIAMIQKTITGVVINTVAQYADQVTRDWLELEVAKNYDKVPIYSKVGYNSLLEVVCVTRHNKVSDDSLTREELIDFCSKYGLTFSERYAYTYGGDFVYQVLSRLFETSSCHDRVVVYVGDKQPRYLSRNYILGPLVVLLGVLLEDVIGADENLLEHLMWVKLYEHVPVIADKLYQLIANTNAKFQPESKLLTELYNHYREKLLGGDE